MENIYSYIYKYNRHTMVENRRNPKVRHCDIIRALACLLQKWHLLLETLINVVSIFGWAHDICIYFETKNLCDEKHSLPLSQEYQNWNSTLRSITYIVFRCNNDEFIIVSSYVRIIKWIILSLIFYWWFTIIETHRL